MHAVARLRAERLARSTRPYLARGSGSVRCEGCRLAVACCCCAERPRADSRSGFCLLMHADESMRPSNTGWLVADVVPDTHAFAWSRTEPDPRLLALLADPARRPFVVFPADDCEPGRVTGAVPPDPERRPLFVVFDGTWAEARKMFRKSPYLDRFPVLAISTGRTSRYRLRSGDVAGGLCTAEVAAECLSLAGEPQPAAAVDRWLDTFVAASRRHRGLLSGPTPPSSAPITG